MNNPTRYLRCMTRHLSAVDDAKKAQTVLGLHLAASLAAYWERQARKAAGLC